MHLHDSLFICALLGYVVATPVIPSQSLSAVAIARRDIAAPKSIRDVAAPKSVRDAAPKSVRDAAPKSVRDAAPKSVRDAAPKSVRDAAPKSVRDAAPKSAREASPEPEHATNGDLAAPNSIYVRDNTEVSSDHVLRYLKDRSLITWVSSGTGQVADISDILWDIGLPGAARRKRSMAPLKNRKRSIPMLADQAMGESDGPMACYEQEIVISSARLVKAIAEVCQSFAEKSAMGTLRIWETTVDGSHIRFGMRVLGSSGSGSDVTVCQSTLSKIEQKCKKSSNSSDGQVELGKEFLFTVDPAPFRLGL